MAVITIDNTGLFERKLSDALDSSLLAMAEVGADAYFVEATKNEEQGPPFDGPHSRPGQYPFRETGKGSDNIAAEGLPGQRCAGFGVRKEGIHLIYLTNRGRRGPIDVIKKYQSKMRVAFKVEMRRKFR